MVNIRELFDAVVDLPPETQLAVPMDTRQEYETVRTKLVKLWAERKEIILAVGADGDPALKMSLCASWNNERSVGAFHLGKPRRKEAKLYSFTVESRVT